MSPMMSGEYVNARDIRAVKERPAGRVQRLLVFYFVRIAEFK
jgi:hypothetical protein